MKDKLHLKFRYKIKNKTTKEIFNDECFYTFEVDRDILNIALNNEFINKYKNILPFVLGNITLIDSNDKFNNSDLKTFSIQDIECVEIKVNEEVVYKVG